MIFLSVIETIVGLILSLLVISSLTRVSAQMRIRRADVMRQAWQKQPPSSHHCENQRRMQRDIVCFDLDGKIPTLSLTRVPRGVILLELCISMALSIVILMVLMQSEQRAIQERAQSRAERDNSYRLSQIQAIASKIRFDIDTHRLPLWPRVHHRGIITYTDGSPHSVMHSIHRPDPNTDAITSLALDLPYSQRVEKIWRDASGEHALVCPHLSPGAALPASSTQAIALNPDLMVEVHLSKIEKKGVCSSLIFEIEKKSMNTVPPSRVPHFFHVLIPISESKTFYVDRMHTLRLIQHEGSATKENQPVLDGIFGFGVSSTSINQGNALSFTITASTKSFSPRRITSSSILSRTSPLSFLTVG